MDLTSELRRLKRKQYGNWYTHSRTILIIQVTESVHFPSSLLNSRR